MKLERADYAAVQAWCGTLSGNELTQNSSGNAQQSSQHAELLWTDSGIKSGISLHELISTKKTKRRRRRMNGQAFSQNAHAQGKTSTIINLLVEVNR